MIAPYREAVSFTSRNGDAAELPPHSREAEQAVLGGRGGGGAPADPRNGTNAVEVLKAILATGPVRAEDVKKETRQAGVAENTLFRAKAMVGVRSRRVGFGPTGVWQWSLAEPSVIPS
jgi:hypothetical protein